MSALVSAIGAEGAATVGLAGGVVFTGAVVWPTANAALVTISSMALAILIVEFMGLSGYVKDASRSFPTITVIIHMPLTPQMTKTMQNAAVKFYIRNQRCRTF
jgi:hypothetical protein